MTFRIDKSVVHVAVLIAGSVYGCGHDDAPGTGSAFDLAITAPADGAHTNGIVKLSATATGGTANEFAFIADGQTTIATPQGPSPYLWTWDTTGFAEGPHTVIAQAMLGDRTIASAPVTIVVDRTHPTVASFTPTSGASDVVLRAPIVVTFSEPLLTSSFDPSSVVLDVAGTTVSTVASLSSDGTKMSLSISDTSTLILPATFSVHMPSGLSDLAGNTVEWS